MNIKKLYHFLNFVCVGVFMYSCQLANRDRIEAKPSRYQVNFNQDWLFTYNPSEIIDTDLLSNEIKDSTWLNVGLPHTWSTYETTGEIHPFIASASERDDSYWFNGWGYYKKSFQIDADLEKKQLSLEFDGVQKYCRIYLNGNFIGDHKGGYTSFYVPISKHVKFNKENILTVAVSNKMSDPYRIPPMTAGNWNIYGGIYRDVRLSVKNTINIPYQGSYKHEGGTFITTPEVSKNSATVAIKTFVQNNTESSADIELQTEVFDPNGEKIKQITSDVTISKDTIIGIQETIDKIENPMLWSVDYPHLYKAVSRVLSNGKQVDSLVTTFGIRHFHWDYDTNDFYLNGEKINIRGTNRHQEYPYVGDAMPKEWTKQDILDIKVNLGHNFMRYAHYPNDPYVYELSDSLGIITVEEVPNIKNLNFSEEVQQQNVIEMIRRDRNHPSIMFWSMGNETNNAADSKWAVAEDTTRIIHLRKGENAGDFIDHDSDNLDLEQLLRVTVRGWEIDKDVPEGINPNPKDGQWAGTEKWQHDLAIVRDGSVRGILGDNCMTWLYNDHGADREYKQAPLLHTNPKGWVDYFRYPKYVYHLTQALYTNIPTIFIQPDTWRSQFLGEAKTITVNSNCDSLALYSGREKIGFKYPDSTSFYVNRFEKVKVKNEDLLAIGWKNGKKYEHKLPMTSEIKSLRLIPEKTMVDNSLSQVTLVEVKGYDAHGNEVLHASPDLKWSISGEGSLVTPETYISDINLIETKNGLGYTVLPIKAMVRSSGKSGKITLKVESPGLESGTCSIETQARENERSLGVIQNKIEGNYISKIKKQSNWFVKSDRLEEIEKVRENVQFPKGLEKKTYQQSLKKLILERNPNLSPATSESKGMQVFVDLNAENIYRLKGVLIADDFNFLLESFYDYRSVERFLENQNLHPKYVQTMKEYLVNKIMKEGMVMSPKDLQFLNNLDENKIDYLDMRFTSDPNKIGNYYRRTIDKSLRVWSNDLKKGLVTAFPELKKYKAEQWNDYLITVKTYNPFVKEAVFPDAQMLLVPIPNLEN
ncbi:glycosyl hydrolase family 2 [Jejuia pallidilutea]|uniref:Glycosyl hydrolase family 2 n=1 Tax=Jejuia pallidilutea TaxID=504487 RepID=A0A362XBC6_9FLAO|nr:glycoside hydrolase family 2 TIM barrel-domain containing protein [Jejuia pallidilutea]PQV51521.1 glycosyl hydrolase family 2 [Jejuia pallidilutea]